MFAVAPCESTPTRSACSAGLSVEIVERVIRAVPSYGLISINELLPVKYKPMGLVRRLFTPFSNPHPRPFSLCRRRGEHAFRTLSLSEGRGWPKAG
jgi:hypothetical protein